MALTVVVRTGTTDGPRLSFDAPRVVIGRGEGCELRLPDPSVSHRHASLRQRGPDWVLVDEGSTNGTWLGSVRLAPQAPRVIQHGQLVRVGRIWLELRLEHALVGPKSAEETRELALALVAEALAGAGEAHAPSVRVDSGPDAGRSLVLTRRQHPYVIGRGSDAALRLEEPDASRHHCELQWRAGQLWVRDLGSKNGTRLGERRLEGGSPQPWAAALPLHIGQDQLSFDDPVARALTELEHAVDEAVSFDEVPPPPDHPPAPSPAPQGDAPPPGAEERPVRSARAPERPSRAPLPSARRRGWTLTDTLVALLALAVLSLSVLGIFWLFRVD